VLDGLQRTALEALLDALGPAGEAREFRADLQHMVAEAMPVAQQQHGLLLERFGAQAVPLRQGVAGGYCDAEGFVVERCQRQSGVREGLGQDGAVQFAGAQHLEQLDGEVFLQHQRHLRCALDDLAHQLRQQVGADGVDDPEAQRAGQRIAAALGDLPHRGGLLQHRLGLAHQLLAQRGHRDLVAAALEDLHVELFLELLDGHAERGLRHMAGLGGTAEVQLAGHRDQNAAR
jgi:hypothetical protein